MPRFFLTLLALGLFGPRSDLSAPTAAAWPHRALVSSPHDRPVTFRAQTIGGELIIPVETWPPRTTNPAARAAHELRALTPRDTIVTRTPANFPMDLSKGPVMFAAEGRDSIHLVVGWNPNGAYRQVKATGPRFTVRLVDGKIVIDPL